MNSSGEKNNRPSGFRSGYVAIIGRPNVGKSTLMNHYLRQKLAIVSPKPQTTRHRIVGILNGDGYQVIFLDTPGVMQPQYLLQETMRKTAFSAAKDADLILMMIEATGSPSTEETFIESLKNYRPTKLLAINKLDLVSTGMILPLIEQYRKYEIFEDIVPVSALKRINLDRLLSCILKHLPESEPYYPPDVISDESERFFVSEIIREQIYLLFGEEIPYSTSVRVEEFRENPRGKDFIRAIVVVERDSQKAILIGRGGQALKRVGRSARQGIEEFLGRSVFLQLDVKVEKKWRKNPSAIRRLGYR